MVEAGHKGQLKGEVKAVRVLRSRNDKIPPQAFSFEIRHVLVENGVKIVGEAAWRCCRQLQIVHLQTQLSACCMAPSVGVKCYV